MAHRGPFIGYASAGQRVDAALRAAWARDPSGTPPGRAAGDPAWLYFSAEPSIREACSPVASATATGAAESHSYWPPACTYASTSPSITAAIFDPGRAHRHQFGAELPGQVLHERGRPGTAGGEPERSAGGGRHRQRRVPGRRVGGEYPVLGRHRDRAGGQRPGRHSAPGRSSPGTPERRRAPPSRCGPSSPNSRVPSSGSTIQTRSASQPRRRDRRRPSSSESTASAGRQRASSARRSARARGLVAGRAQRGADRRTPARRAGHAAAHRRGRRASGRTRRRPAGPGVSLTRAIDDGSPSSSPLLSMLPTIERPRSSYAARSRDPATSDQFSTYRRSSRTASSHGRSDRPDTCHRPVMPGLTASRRRHIVRRRRPTSAAAAAAAPPATSCRRGR